MSAPRRPLRLAVCGAYPVGDGYPNTTYLLQALAADPRADTVFLGKAVETGEALWKLSRRGLVSKARHAFAWLAGSASSVVRVVRTHRATPFDAAYLPYPALLPLVIFRFVPRSWRPRLVADGFISIWDSVTRDRRMLDERSLRARVLHWIERHALRGADAIHVDTTANRDYLARELGIDIAKIRVAPLAIDERTFRRVPLPPERQRVRVLYVGTFVPLHGVGTICDAIRLVDARLPIDFVFVGSGQDDAAVDALVREPGRDNVQWINGWCGSAELFAHVADADLCLGVFGDTQKARRVFPFKNYIYARCGRAIVSSVPCSFPGATPSSLPFVPVPAASPRELADAIETLAADPELRRAAAEAAMRYYEESLGNERAASAVIETVDAFNPDAGT